MELTIELLRKVARFDFFHLPTFDAAADFAGVQAVNTECTVVCFTYTYKRFQLHVVGVSERTHRPLVAAMGGVTFVNRKMRLAPLPEAP